MNAIVAEDLHFLYADARGDQAPFALHLPEWSVPTGSRTALFGPSGCGKSTVLNLVAGLLVPASGSLRVLGHNIGAMSEAQRRAQRIASIGFIFQDFPLVDYLDATENVLLPYRINPALSLDTGARSRAASLLEELELGGLAHRKPAALSQGERQRVAIARALVAEPSLLLADEPTAGLDPERASSFMDMLDGLARRRDLTVLMVTHDPTLLPRFDHTLSAGELRTSVGGAAR